MQKSDGSFWLAVWNDSAANETLTLTLDSTASAITEYDPLTGTSAIGGASNSNVFTFTLPDHPVLLQIGGAQSSPATSIDTSPATAATDTAASPPASSPAPTATTAAATPLTAATTLPDTAQSIVATVNGGTVAAGNGDNNVFLASTGNTVTLGNGNNTVQGYNGGNSITSGAGNDSIRIAGSGNTIDAGGGANTIADSGSNNTIILNAGGTDDIWGYVLQQGDTLDLRPALTAAGYNGDPSTIGAMVQTATVNNSAVISVGGSAVATLEGSGPLSQASLLQHATI